MKPTTSNSGETERRRGGYARGRLAFLAIVTLVMLTMAGKSIAQGPTPTPTPPPVSGNDSPDGADIALDSSDATATQISMEATATQTVLDLTATSDYSTQAAIDAMATSSFATQAAIQATATGQYYATQTATIQPKPTVTFQPLSVVLLVEPRNSQGTYNPSDKLKFSIRLWNTGNLREDRQINVVLLYDTKTFRQPAEGSISDNGQSDEGTITWQIEDGIFPGEDSAKVFSFDTEIRSDLATSTEGTVQVVVSNRSGVMLAQTEPMHIPAVVAAEATTTAPQTGSTVQVPQGEGLFHDSGSFALLIGLFFSLGLVGIFVLGGLVIYLAREDESKEQAFTGTTEIFLLLLVLFSVIVMGVQNAIDRESINAIIGGIVGYVAGRARSRVSLPLDLFRGRDRPVPSEAGNGSASTSAAIPAPEAAATSAAEVRAADPGEDSTQ